MNKLKVLVAGAAIAVSGSAASAASIYADSVVSFNQGFCDPAGPNLNANDCRINRSDPMAALGAADGDFVSLGFGGDLTLTFVDAPFSSADAEVFEVTFNRASQHQEAADVFAVLGGIETYIATIFNAPDGVGTAKITSEFDSIKLVDVTLDYFANTTSFDGFDVDAVGISPVPLPAAGLMLLAGLGGLAAMRRKS